MMREDRLLDQQIRDAYGRIELSEDAQDRMLASLLAAQAIRANTGDGAVPQTPHDDAGSPMADAPVVPFLRRHGGWRVWLPIAAAAVVALVVVQVRGLVGANRVDAARMTVAQTSEKAAGGAAYDDAGTSEDAASEEGQDAEESMSLDSAPLATTENGVAPAEDDALTAGLYPCVTLDDATQLTTLGSDGTLTQVDEASVGDSVCSAVAASADACDTMACELFELVGESDAYAVRYEGEQSYWRCVPAG